MRKTVLHFCLNKVIFIHQVVALEWKFPWKIFQHTVLWQSICNQRRDQWITDFSIPITELRKQVWDWKPDWIQFQSPCSRQRFWCIFTVKERCWWHIAHLTSDCKFCSVARLLCPRHRGPSQPNYCEGPDLRTLTGSTPMKEQSVMFHLQNVGFGAFCPEKISLGQVISLSG